MNISIILPTRKRKDALVKSLTSLLENADDPKGIEIMLGVDQDDTETIDFIQNGMADFLNKYQSPCQVRIFEPQGYEKLNVYVNTLAQNSSGKWLFLWNDDCLMQTKGWDSVVTSYDGQFKLLSPKDNHNHPFAIFPLIPRDWIMLNDVWSYNAQNDTWVSVIARLVGVFERIDIEVLHDRADLTGNNNDETFANRKYMEGNPEHPEDFNNPRMVQLRMAQANKTNWFLEKTGQGGEYFKKVLAKEIDPFEDVKTYTNVQGGGQLPAKDEKLVL